MANKKPATISIIGCGWLGLPLAAVLVKKGYAVKGSTTRPEKVSMLKEKGIEPYLIQLTPVLDGDASFFNTDLLVVNIPPGLRRGMPVDHHVNQIKAICAELPAAAMPGILYVSATSVYKPSPEPINENGLLDRDSPRALALLQAEDYLKEVADSLTIVRAGGLLGYDRRPGKYVAGKKDLPGRNSPVNYIHRDDAVMALAAIIEQGLWGETFNLVAPEKPTREQVYLKSTQALGLEPPTFSQVPEDIKSIDANKIMRMASLSFSYPNPLAFV